GQASEVVGRDSVEPETARSYGRGAPMSRRTPCSKSSSWSTSPTPVRRSLALPRRRRGRSLGRDRYFEPGLLRLFEYTARPTICYPRVRSKEGARSCTSG